MRLDARRPDGRTTKRPPAPPRRARGIALMLVLVAVGAAAVIGAAVLSMRNTTPQTAANAMAAVRAKWEANSTIETAVAAFEAGMSAGDDPSGIAGMLGLEPTSVQVKVTDLNGDPVGDDDTDLLLTVKADVNGVKMESVRVLALTPTPASAAEVLSPTLDEFGVYAEDGFEFYPGGSIKPWDADDANARDGVVAIGLGFNPLSALRLSGATPAGLRLFCDQDGSGGLATECEAAGGWRIPCNVPAAAANLPSGITALAFTGSPMTFAGSTRDRTVPAGQGYGDVSVSSEAILRFDNAVAEHYEVGAVTLDSSAVVVIHGDVVLHATGPVLIDNGATIELDADARLTLLLSSDLRVRNSGAIGVDRAAARAGVGPSAFLDPSRIQILQVSQADGGAASPSWVIESTGMIVGNLHAPSATIDLSDAAVFGRMTGGRVRFYDGGVLNYAPSFDSRAGLTNIDGPLYDAGVLMTEVADGLDAVNTAGGLDAVLAAIVGIDLGGGAAPADGEPTPRKASTAQARSLSSAVALFEGLAAGGAEAAAAEAAAKAENTADLLEIVGGLLK